MIRILTHHGWKDLKDYVICSKCGKAYPEFWMAPSFLWEFITGCGKGQWCIHCFNKEALAMGVTLKWTCEAIPNIDTDLINKMEI